MREDEIRELFSQGMDCSQIVLAQFAPQLGMAEETANRIASCFGGGMMCGQTCGAVTGALMALGLKYGHGGPDQQEEKVKAILKSAAFREKFLSQYKSLECKTLLGIDISAPGGMDTMAESGLMLTFCPKVIAGAEAIIEELLSEEA